MNYLKAIFIVPFYSRAVTRREIRKIQRRIHEELAL